MNSSALAPVKTPRKRLKRELQTQIYFVPISEEESRERLERLRSNLLRACLRLLASFSQKPISGGSVESSGGTNQTTKGDLCK